MSFLDLFSGNISSIVDSVGKVIDSLTTTDKEKLTLKNKFASEMNNFKLQVMQAKNDYEKELTERLKIDMTSDSWLSKNIRPLTLIFILVMFSILSITNGFGLKYDASYVELLKEWGSIAFIFYFGSRGYEKITKIKNK